MPTERIDLSRVDDPRDVVHRAVACLAGGGLLAVPTATGHALAVSAIHPSAIGRLPASADGHVPALTIRGHEELPDWVPDAPELARRLARKIWPGPAILRLAFDSHRGLSTCLADDVKGRITGDGRISLRVPAQPYAGDILRFVQGPLVFVDAPPDLIDTADMALVDSRRRPPDPGATVIEVDADAWRVAREGALKQDALARMAGTVVLFVCTGNTCRSPMAEAICKTVLAERLGIARDELPERGLFILSAGIGANEGMPAAAHAAEIVRNRGGSLADHRSRRVTPRLGDEADVIVAMTRDHRDALLYHMPDLADRVRLLDPEGGDVDDPIGADRATYRRTAETIEKYLGHLLADLGL